MQIESKNLDITQLTNYGVLLFIFKCFITKICFPLWNEPTCLFLASLTYKTWQNYKFFKIIRFYLPFSKHRNLECVKIYTISCHNVKLNLRDFKYLIIFFIQNFLIKTMMLRIHHRLPIVICTCNRYFKSVTRKSVKV